jgi:predicted HicB family RNase H-like nuclease
MPDEKKPSNQIGLRLEPEVREALENEADRLALPLATYINSILKRYVRGDTIRREVERGKDGS